MKVKRSNKTFLISNMTYGHINKHEIEYKAGCIELYPAFFVSWRSVNKALYSNENSMGFYQIYDEYDTETKWHLRHKLL